MTETMTSAELLDHIGGSGKPKDPKRVITGTRTQNAGKVFEQDMERANAVYNDLGVARIEKLPVATAPMPRSWMAGAHQKKSGIARILSERAPFDYYGTLGGEHWGRAIAMECKATKEQNRLPLGEKKTIKSHQITACADSYNRFGTISVLVWKNGEKRGVLLPPQIVEVEREMRIGTMKSIPWSMFVEYPVQVIDEIGGGDIEHWLGPVFDWIEANEGGE